MPPIKLISIVDGIDLIMLFSILTISFNIFLHFPSFQPFQEHDMSVELYNQHTAISELQQVEDEMIDQLKLMADFSTKFVPELMDLCRMTNDPDYDQDGE